MTVHLYLAPAAAGKTAYVLDLARRQGLKLQGKVHLCVSNEQQVGACRRRLAQRGGALGVEVLTFPHLYAAILDAAGQDYIQLDSEMQYRLLRTVVAGLPLHYYASLVQRPGFVQELQRLIGDLKAAGIDHEDFLETVKEIDAPPRLYELGLIYADYQRQLLANRWADYNGLGWLAAERLDQEPELAQEWPLLLVDGFDDFTTTQLRLLQRLAQRVGRLVITLTGPPPPATPRLALRRFTETKERLEERLALQAEPLPEQMAARAPLLAHLESGLFNNKAAQRPAAESLTLVEAADRQTEVRAALRWLKTFLMKEEVAVDQVALLARSLDPYRSFVVQTAAEFGLPVRVLGGLPLSGNPAVAALVDLLRLALPADAGDSGLALPYAGVLAALRSPYFDWHHARLGDGGGPVDMRLRDVDALGAAARWGNVVGGEGQWREVLQRLARRRAEEVFDDERRPPADVLAGRDAVTLQQKFDRFVDRLRPPELEPMSGYVRWLEQLIGPESSEGTKAAPLSLQMLARVQAGGATVAYRDHCALKGLKQVLRSLVWGEQLAGKERVLDYAAFFNELSGALEAATYDPAPRSGVLVADENQLQGVSFAAIAILGLAEGEFPTTLTEDPLLTERDRQQLQQAADLPLRSAVTSYEREFFYRAVTRARQRLLLTRPRLAEGGAEWPPSPFWEEVRRLAAVEPEQTSIDRPVTPAAAASLPELIHSLARYDGFEQARNWLIQGHAARQNGLQQAAQIFRIRFTAQDSPFDGDLTEHATTFGQHFSSDHGWSPSQLEQYRSCAYFFFVSRALGLEPRLPPQEGLDVAQLGTIYHEILEYLYRSLTVEARRDVAALLEALPGIAKRVLDAAPRQQGFRETAWWQETRREIVRVVERTVRALAQLPGDYEPVAFEARFTRRRPLRIQDEDDQFYLRGVVDRIDRDPSGRLRVIDYKTAGPWSYGARALDEGKRLQLPLYALAARDALGLGRPADGFYWHIRQAEPSGLRLADYGLEAALALATEFAWAAVRGARAGAFRPTPPDGGCPDYCPAATFCWHYQPGRWG